MAIEKLINALHDIKNSAKPDMSHGIDIGKIYYCNGFKSGIDYAINQINQYVLNIKDEKSI